MENEKKDEEKTLQENLKDPIYVNFNLLTKLEEIKRINYAILQIMNKIIQKELQNKKEEREGTFKNK